MKSVLVLDGRVGKPQKSQPDPTKEATQPLKPEGNILLQGGQKDSHKQMGADRAQTEDVVLDTKQAVGTAR